MEKIELRKKDFVTSIILVIFGIWMLVYTVSTMPMKDSFSGVINVWYVSPALFPLGIGSFLILGGWVLMARAVRDGGAKRFFEDLSSRGKESSGKTFRLFGILLPIFAYVYLNIPRIDFFLSTIFCLVVFMTFFYFDDSTILKKLFRFYLIGCLFFVILFSVGVHEKINGSFPYFMDILVFLFLLAYIFYCAVLIRGDQVQKKKMKLTLITSVITSLFLIPAFKFLLLVPLPVEGGFIEIMNIIRYAFR